MADGYWQSAAEDEAMQEEHAFIWDALLDIVDVELAGARVLDAGCNRGGFLRLLVDRRAIGAGFGYDPAGAAIDDARRLAGERPLEFAAGDTVPDGWYDFDVAFSHEVLYLLHDLPRHDARSTAHFAIGGVYYAVIGVHAGSPLMVDFHKDSADALKLPELYSIDDVVAIFAAEGFDVAVGAVTDALHSCRRPRTSTSVGRMLEWLEYYYEHKLVLRLRRSGSSTRRQVARTPDRRSSGQML